MRERGSGRVNVAFVVPGEVAGMGHARAGDALVELRRPFSLALPEAVSNMLPTPERRRGKSAPA